MPVYVAAARKIINDQVVPDVAGLDAVKWRWIAQAPWWYFEACQVLIGAKAAPAAYPNGIPLSGSISKEWFTGVPEEKDPLDGIPDALILKSVKIRKRQHGNP